jgi:SAM-dependent methyltransferase
LTVHGSPPPDDLVREIHESVAASDNLAEASVRPPETTRRQIRLMQRDVVRKLQLEPDTSVLEIGCGVALLGVPVALSSARYVGVDFAPEAVVRANQRFAGARVEMRAKAQCMDVLVSAASFRRLGTFDRVLMYAVMHYARDEAEARTFLKRASDALNPGGRALIGNIPLEDVKATFPRPAATKVPHAKRLLDVAMWTVRPERSAVRQTRVWKMRWVLESSVRSRLGSRSGGTFDPVELPPNYTLPLSAQMIDQWLAAMPNELDHHWEVPSPGVPLAAGRADLVMTRRDWRSS